MTDYSKLVKALRNLDMSDPCPCEDSVLCKESDCIVCQAAAAIEELQAEVKRLNMRCADCEYAASEWPEDPEHTKTPKRGKWELIDGAEPMRWGCSRCKYMSWDTSNYCPKCGADMRKMEVQDGK